MFVLLMDDAWGLAAIFYAVYLVNFFLKKIMVRIHLQLDIFLYFINRHRRDSSLRFIGFCGLHNRVHNKLENALPVIQLFVDSEESLHPFRMKFLVKNIQHYKIGLFS